MIVEPLIVKTLIIDRAVVTPAEPMIAEIYKEYYPTYPAAIEMFAQHMIVRTSDFKFLQERDHNYELELHTTDGAIYRSTSLKIEGVGVREDKGTFTYLTRVRMSAAKFEGGQPDVHD